jgi:hypothetical protein
MTDIGRALPQLTGDGAPCSHLCYCKRSLYLAEIERLRSALKPFADLALWHDTYPDGPDTLSSGDMMTQYITADMVRDARKATAE